MSQLRLNPLTGRWVTLVADRAKRPTDFVPRLMQVEADPNRACPFCPGNEEATPPALEQHDSEGKWTLRVVPNLYPAFDGDGNLAVHNLGPVHTMADASGIHEVFVITPDHNARVGTFTDEVIHNVMQALKRRFEEHARTSNVRYTQAFINHGREAGASLAHPHGQILGLPFVPGEILEEERWAIRAAHHSAIARCAPHRFHRCGTHWHWQSNSRLTCHHVFNAWRRGLQPCIPHCAFAPLGQLPLAHSLVAKTHYCCRL